MPCTSRASPWGTPTPCAPGAAPSRHRGLPGTTVAAPWARREDVSVAQLIGLLPNNACESRTFLLQAIAKVESGRGHAPTRPRTAGPPARSNPAESYLVAAAPVGGGSRSLLDRSALPGSRTEEVLRVRRHRGRQEARKARAADLAARAGGGEANRRAALRCSTSSAGSAARPPSSASPYAKSCARRC